MVDLINIDGAYIRGVKDHQEGKTKDENPFHDYGKQMGWDQGWDDQEAVRPHKKGESTNVDQS